VAVPFCDGGCVHQDTANGGRGWDYSAGTQRTIRTSRLVLVVVHDDAFATVGDRTEPLDDRLCCVSVRALPCAQTGTRLLHLLASHSPARLRVVWITGIAPTWGLQEPRAT